jgi:hypothetical protein
VSTKKLTFAHVSDIHFIRGFSGESPFDIDKPVREAILADARTMRDDVGPVRGMLVTGDIAYAGKASEYKTALEWLGQLTDILRCEREFLWCVPGNHDVDQSVLRENTAILALHDRLRNVADKEGQLRADLELESTGRLLLSPLKAYNEEFAARMDCLSRPRQPWWTTNLELNDGSTLCLRGLNSTIISGLDPKAQMFLGAFQTDYGRTAGVEYLTLCHHPIDWLLDKDKVEQALIAYSRISLFGHKHIQKGNQIDNTLWLVAGAVHPDRRQPDWQPRYNYLSIEVNGSGENRYMSVDVYARVWSQTERQFTREQGSYPGQFHNYKLKLPAWAKDGNIDEKGDALGAAMPQNAGPDQRTLALNRKKLLFRFGGLPHHTKIAIMRRFDLLQDDDQKLSDAELIAACFERARSKGVHDQVWVPVEAQSAC